MIINQEKSLKARFDKLDNVELQSYVEEYLEERLYSERLLGGIFGVFFCPFSEEEEITRREYLIAKQIIERRESH